MHHLELNIDWSSSSLLKHTWSGIVNVDQFKWLGRKDIQDALAMARDELGAQHVRAVGMFSWETRVIDIDPVKNFSGDKTSRVNYQIIDAYIDMCLETGVVPMITTCFTPEPMATTPQRCFDGSCHVSKPRDIGEFASFCEDTLRHFVYRYGSHRMEDWLFEIWNEPNLEDSFWVGGQQSWFQLWKAVHAAFRRVNPNFRVGGPSTARGEWMADFLQFCSKEDCSPDYLIGHCYNNDSANGALSPFCGPQNDRVNKSPNFLSGVVRGVKGIAEEFGFPGEVHWNEWGRSWFPADAIRESENEAAFICKTMSEVSQEADAFAYWCLSDIYNQLGYGAETFHKNYGALNLQGIRKPPYLAQQLLTRLGNKRHPLVATGGDDCLNAMATSKDARRQVLVYSFEAEGATSPEPVLVKLNGLSPCQLFRITDAENNAVTRWNENGSPGYLRFEDVKRLRDESSLRSSPLKEVESNADGSLSFMLPGRGVALLEMAEGSY